MNILFEIIYYALFIGLGLFMINKRDTWASKLVRSQRMIGFIFKKNQVSEANELIFANGLFICIGLIFIAFGLYKLLKL